MTAWFCPRTNISANPIRLVLRLDDPSATSNLEIEQRILAALAERGLSCTFAVIPYRDTETGRIPLSRERAAHMIAAQCQGLLDIALHGYLHRDAKLAAQKSEFECVPVVLQRTAIQAGKALLEDLFEQQISGFVPPWNTYDRYTLRILEELGFHYLSANLTQPPARQASLRLLPLTCHLPEIMQAITEARRFAKLAPVVIVVMHHYDFPGGGGKSVYTSFAEFEEMLSWLTEQGDVRVCTLAALAEELSDREARLWQRQLSWRNRLPWRYRNWLPSLCLTTRVGF